MILSSVVGVLFIVTGGVKLLGIRQSVAVRDHLGLSPRLWRTIGGLELAGAAGVLIGLRIELLGMAALGGLVLLMLGATASRVRVHDKAFAVLADVAVVGLVVVTAIALMAA
ncbi:DoxX family protein [Nocardia vinacea]|uniref:DoxX family protein n=1 Tax=Nocardia vinacea TaxID=96468 RepID=UPI003414D836